MNRAGFAPARRALLAALGLAAVSLGRIARAGSIIVATGTPHQLPLAAVAELDIELPARIDDEPVDLAVLNLGALDLPSGRLAAMDALLPQGAPFAQAVEPGSYPLQIVLARTIGGEERIAFAVVKLADRPATTWSNALVEGEDPAELADDELAGFDVESGLACLIDASMLAPWRSELADDENLLRDLERALRENQRPNWTWARIRAGSGSGLLFSAGLGEGFYACYWGQDKNGAVATLVIDFDLLDWAGLPAEEPVTA